ncbi:WbqC family protein [Flavobacterium croceum]|uniref:WbqC-like protein n=1 Tax=Flavobacterium croceum DSM 17960 TaxID=1121886 RepID=A0A2S4N6U3_9FLAO|nr:WbqC family protein [Flavobacterium croceum]POS01407.1 WbqC-like protein [Flavobacterium croceum DSM 17960]
MNILLYPSYFPSISHFIAIAKSNLVTFEIEDNFQKQTNRNRMYIYSPNGIQLLNIPVKHSKEAHQKTKDVRIETAFNWQKQHFKSLEAAYRTSPFFEYFEDEFYPIFEKKHEFLLDLNYKTMEIASKCLQLDFDYNETEEYFTEVPNKIDYRNLVNGKKDYTVITPYKQVFDDKHGFLNNLSILDLLCNEGRYALEYLKNQTL